MVPQDTSRKPVQRMLIGGPHAFDVSWRERLLVLGGAGSAVLVALVLGLILAHEATLELVGLVPASMFVVGKFLPLWGVTDRSHFGPYELGMVIWALDTVTAIVWVYALEGLVRFERLRRGIERIREGAALVLEAYPGIRKAAVLGLIMFVLFPVAGTGAMIGTFVGILLGLHRALLIATVSFGGLLGGTLMALAADHFAARLLRFQEMQQSPLMKYGSLAAMVLAIVVLVWFLNRAYRRALDQARARRQSAVQPIALP
jgi:uncharacterized membrane protein